MNIRALERMNILTLKKLIEKLPIEKQEKIIKIYYFGYNEGYNDGQEDLIDEQWRKENITWGG